MSKHRKSNIDDFIDRRLKCRPETRRYFLDLRGVAGVKKPSSKRIILRPPGSRYGTLCQREARDLADAFYRERFDANGKYIGSPEEGSPRTLDKVQKDHLDSAKEEGARPATLQKLGQSFRRVERFFGEELKNASPTIDDLNDAGVLAAFRKWRRKQKTRAGTDPAPNTVRNDCAAISGLLRHAFKTGLIPSSAATQLTLPRLNVQKPRRSLGPDEAGLLLVCAWLADRSIVRINKRAAPLPLDRRHMRLGHKAPNFMFPLLATFLLTGGRLQEVLTIPWSNVDFRGRMITLKQTKMKRDANRRATRHVPMMPQLHAILRWYRYECPDRPSGPLLFPGREADVPLKDIRASRKELVLRAGINPEVTPHYLRHTYAAMRCQTIERGAAIDLLTVASELGQKGLTQLEQTYGHLLRHPDRHPDVRYPLVQHLPELARFDPSSTDFDWAALDENPLAA